MLDYQKPIISDVAVLRLQTNLMRKDGQIVQGSLNLQSNSDDDLWLKKAKKELFYVVRNEMKQIVGLLSLKERLEAYDAIEGGHLAYTVFPEFQNIGIGNEVFTKGLEILTELKIYPIFVSCRESNAASEAIIIKNGGKLSYQKQVNHYQVNHYRIMPRE